MIKRMPALTGAVFQTDSPFIHLPRDIDPTQRRFFEALRFGVEMAQVSYSRLRHTLSAMSLGDQQTLETFPEPVAAAFLDAWSIVDSVHRVRGLLNAMPRLKKGALFKIFNRETQTVEALRNRVQHLSGDLHNSAFAHLPVWGTLSWIWLVDRTHQKIISGSIWAGVDVGRSARSFPIPGDRIFHDVLDHVSLSVGSDEFNLSEAMRLTIRVGRHMEKQMTAAFQGLERLPLVDSMVLLNIELGAPVVVAPSGESSAAADEGHEP